MWMLYFAFLAVLAVCGFAAGEFIVRAKGAKPFAVQKVEMKVDPGGSLFTTHHTLGYAHSPGRYDVTLPSGYTFTITHGEDSLRLTREADFASLPGSSATGFGDEDHRQLWILGCSFTYGWSINDHETFPWLLQEALPDYSVVNFGVSGYGTIHSLRQFNTAIEERPKPSIVVLVYAHFHDMRNTFTRTWRKAVAPWNRMGLLRQPSVRLDESGLLDVSMVDVTYREWPFMRQSALIHFVESHYNEWAGQRC